MPNHTTGSTNIPNTTGTSDTTASVHQSMPFAAAIGLRNVRVSPEGVTANADWAPQHCTANGVLHGGYLMSLADTIGALCSGPHLPQGSGSTTTESKTNFLRPITSGAVTITATPVNIGRTLVVVQTDITRDDGKLATRTTQTQLVLTR